MSFAGIGAGVTIPRDQTTLTDPFLETEFPEFFPSAPSSINPGTSTLLRITLSNNNVSDPVTSLSFDGAKIGKFLPGTLPNGLKIAGIPKFKCIDPGNAANNTSGILGATIGGQEIEIDNATPPISIPPQSIGGADGSCSIYVPVTAGTSDAVATSYSYTIDDESVMGDDNGSTVKNQGSVSQSVNVAAILLPTISKSFSNNVAILGGAVRTLTITVANPNIFPVENFSVSDTFPVLNSLGIIKIASIPAAPTCTGSGIAPIFNPAVVIGDTSVSVDSGTIAAGESCTILVYVEANHTNGGYQTPRETNTINGSTDFDSDIGFVPANATARIRTRSPLVVSTAFNNPSIASGQSDTLTITFANNGDSDITIDEFIDNPIDGGVSNGIVIDNIQPVVCSGTGSGGTYSIVGGGAGIEHVGDGILSAADTTIAAGETCTITLEYTGTIAVAGIPLAVTHEIQKADITTLTTGVFVQDSTSASLLIADDLNVSKQVFPANPAPGEPVRYVLTVQNWKNSTISNLAITDSLDSGTFLTGIIDGVNYTPTLTTVSGAGVCSGLSTTSSLGDGSAVFNITSVPARFDSFASGSCSVTFYVMTPINASDGDSITNTLGAGSVCYNSGGVDICNGGASNTTDTTVDGDILTITKSFDPAGPLNEGVVTRMTMELSNASANALTNASISDSLPSAVSGGGQMKISSPANASSTCVGASITATADSNSITMNSATIPERLDSGFGSKGTCKLEVDVVAAAGIYNNFAVADATHNRADSTSASTGAISNTANIAFSSTIEASKTFEPDTVSSGGNSTVRIRLSNSGNVGITNLSLTDPLPTGMVLANPFSASTTCGGVPSFSGVAGNSSITVSGITIGGNATCDVLFNVNATGNSDWVNTIPVGNITADGNISNQSPIVGPLKFSAGVGVSLSKTAQPSIITFPGQVSKLVVEITAGSTALTNLSVTDYFTVDGTSGGALNGMRIAPNPQKSTTCSGGTVVATSNGTSLSVSGITLPASTIVPAFTSSCTFSANIISIQPVGITNTIPVGAISSDQGLSNASLAQGNLNTQTSIGITKNFTPNNIKPGERSRLKVTLVNPTVNPASNASVTDTLEGGLTLAENPNITTTCSGATISSTSTSVTISGATIPAASGSSPTRCSFEADVTAAVQGDYPNTIPAEALVATLGGQEGNNAEPATDILRVKSPLEIHLAIDSKTLDLGNPVTFTTGDATSTAGTPKTMTIAITNPNSSELTNVALTNALPANLAISQTPNASTTCTGGSVSAPASGTSIALTGATVSGISTCTITVDVVSNIFGTHTDSIPAGNVTSFEGVTNEEPTSAQIIISNPPVISKEFSPAVMSAGGVSKLTISLSNDNSAAITLTSDLVDSLPTSPGNLVIHGTPALDQGTCIGTVTASGDKVTVSSGLSIPSGGCQISVNVTATTVGTYINNIPAAALKTTAGNNQQPTNATLDVSTAGFISGKVFKDNDTSPNGTFDFGTDEIISSVSIELRSGATCAGSLLDTKVTDVGGNYLFFNLSAGIYSVCQNAQPTGTINGITSKGAIVSSNGSTGDPGGALNPTSTTSQITGIDLKGDGVASEISGSVDNNFAEVVPSTISGTVFLDENNNGVQNGADDRISGVTIQLLNSSDDFIDDKETDSDGNYSFADIEPGTYSILQPTQPANSNNGLTVAGTVLNGGTSGTATGVLVTPSKISSIILPPNVTTSGNNFAEIPNSKTISGSIFLDYDNDGLENNSDYGLNNITLKLTGTDSNGNSVVSQSVTTNSSGIFSFTGLPAGTYTIDQLSQPTGTTNGTTTVGSSGTASSPTTTSSRIASIDIANSDTVSGGYNFAEVPDNTVDLTIAKSHNPSSFGEYSSTGVFTIVVDNIGSVATSGAITVVDTLPAGITIAEVVSADGWSCSGAAGTSTLTCTTNSVVNGGVTAKAIKLRVTVANGTLGQVLINNVTVSGGNETKGFQGNNSASDSVGISSTATVSGRVWLDDNQDQIFGVGERDLSGWKVELILNGSVVQTATTASDGTYTLSGIAPGAGYNIQFRQPNTNMIFGGAVTNENGVDINGGGTITTDNPSGADVKNHILENMQLSAGDNITHQSLPLDPSGVVYDSTTRDPIENAVITISYSGTGTFTPADDLVSGSSAFTTGSSGFYQFLLNPSAPNGDYTLTITTYPSGYNNAPSTSIPVCTNKIIAGTIINPANIQSSSSAPVVGITPHDEDSCIGNTDSLIGTNQDTTQYFKTFDITLATSAEIFNNHIPLDPATSNSVVVTKTSPLINVSVGSLVPYKIKVENTTNIVFNNSMIVDTMPPGFKYVEGSASIDGISKEPIKNGRVLTWTGNNLAAKSIIEVNMLLVVGTGVQTGKYDNRAYILDSTGSNTISNVGIATVNVVPDPIFDCSEIIGKVFDDTNNSGYHDEGEVGIPNVRVVTVNGLLVTTDDYGRFHVACAQIPDADRGSNFIMKLDTRTLPSGYKVSSENPRVVRLTRGKMTKLNFGASLSKTLQLDLKDEAFEKGSVSLKKEWAKALATIHEKIKEGVTLVKINYQKEKSEDKKLSKQRLKETSGKIKDSIKDCCENTKVKKKLIKKEDAR
ncbi:MAG: putative repeat protein (TIGR01451 family) [Lentimonas sp.]|jgi:uncharacterized repeat protein (TIGR01451 family)